MFDSLSDRLNDTFDRLRGKGKLTEADITSAMRDIRMALLEADVNFKVVKEFVAKTKERCMTARGYGVAVAGAKRRQDCARRAHRDAWLNREQARL